MAIDITSFPGWTRGWAKPDRRPIYEWAKQHLTLPPAYAVQGPFDVSISRPLMEVFDDLQNPLVNRISFRKPPRFGGTMVIDIAIPWIICNDPGPIMWAAQTDDDARGHMKEKVWPLWNTCKPLKAMMPRNPHDKTTTEIFFGPFFMISCGANINNFQSKGIRWLFNEEIWLPQWQELYSQAVYRTRDFERAGSYKITNVSQAGNVDDVEDRNFKAGHQAQWGYEVDGKHYPLLFGGEMEGSKKRWGLIWDDDAKTKSGAWNKARACETARYLCPHTGKVFDDSTQTRFEWNRDGAYITCNNNSQRHTRSYAVNALLTRTMADLVAEKIDAMELASRGDLSLMRDYVQKAETRPWEEKHTVITLSDDRSGYVYGDYDQGQTWDGEIARTMMIDRQGGKAGDTAHTWVDIRAWKQGGDSRQLYFGRLDTKEARRLIQKKYNVSDRLVWQDANFEKHEVYKECAEYGWTAFHGTNEKSWIHLIRVRGHAEPLKYVLPYSPIQVAEVAGTNLKAFYIKANGDYFADILANLVVGRGVKFEHPDDAHPEFLKGLQGEHKVEKRPGVFTWEKIHSSKSNHSWDTSKMGVNCACVLKLLSLPE